MHVLRVHLLVQNPGIAAACVEQRSYLLRRLVANVDVRDIAVVDMVIQVQSQTARAGLLFIIQLALIH